MTDHHELWVDFRIPGFAFRLAELGVDEAEKLIIDEFDPVADENSRAAISGAGTLGELQVLAARTRALWPKVIGKDAVGPAKNPMAIETPVRNDLSIAGSLAAKAGEIVVTFKDNMPVIETRSYRAPVLVELNTAVAEGWLIRRCGFCGGLYPARRVTRGAVAYCGTRCRSMAIRAGAAE